MFLLAQVFRCFSIELSAQALSDLGFKSSCFAKYLYLNRQACSCNHNGCARQVEALNIVIDPVFENVVDIQII